MNMSIYEFIQSAGAIAGIAIILILSDSVKKYMRSKMYG